MFRVPSEHARGHQRNRAGVDTTWNEFFLYVVARGLTGVRLVASDAHQGLVEAVAANLPGASWQLVSYALRGEPDVRYAEEHVDGGQSDGVRCRAASHPTP